MRCLCSLRRVTALTRSVLVAVALTLVARAVAAADQVGRVTFGGLPVPGASIVARQGETTHVTATDENGAFRLAELAAGTWVLRVEMSGFDPIAQDMSIRDSDNPPLAYELKLQPLQQIAASAPPSTPSPQGEAPATATGGGARPSQADGNSAFQRAPVTAAPASAGAPAPAAPPPVPAQPAGDPAADGLLVNGSVNNGAASAFAQLPAFGNNRRGARSLFNGGVALLMNNSAFDSRPFSFGNIRAAKPSYNDVQINGSFAGPVKVPGLRNKANLFLGYQRTINHTASAQSTIVPTLLERAGDFSQSSDALGRRLTLVDPDTARPFAGNLIPASRVSTQAAALLNYFQVPNLDPGGRFNYQSTILGETHQDALQVRFNEALDAKNQLTGVFAYQRTTTDASNVFNFVDATRVAGVDTTITWSHRFSPFTQVRLHYQFTRLATTVTPFFSGRINVSGDAGLTGNDQTPANWGPPALLFASGIANPATAQYAANTTGTHVWGGEQLWSRGRHTVTVGSDVRWQQWTINGQQDARGTLSFTGAASGSDLADFLLGIPNTSSIAFGNADKYLPAPDSTRT